MKILPLCVSAALLALSAGAEAAPVTYTIDPTHTFPVFEINHLGLSTFRGRFNDTRGTVILDTEKKTGQVEVSIQVDSVDSGVAKLDEHLRGSDFFDAAKYPTIEFKGNDFRFEGEKLVSVKGDLSMRGVTKPVTLEVEQFTCKTHPLRGVWTCGADLRTRIQRSDWGVSAYIPAVADTVELKIEVEAAVEKEAKSGPR